MKRVAASLLASAGLLAAGPVAAAPASAAVSADACVRGNIAIRYVVMGGEASILGRPVVCQTATATGGAYDVFERGVIYWSPASGAWDVSGEFLNLWSWTGWENGFLRYPTSTENPIRSGGVYQVFQGGTLYWSPASGAHSVSGSFRDLFGATGWENGLLGYPLSQEADIRAGGVYQVFQGGVAYWSPTTGAHSVSGEFLRLYATTGYENGYLGYPTTQEVAGRAGGVHQDYQGGALFWSPQTGARALQGPILDRYRRAGAEDGVLGYPTSGEFDVPGGRRVDFQHGFIEWSPALGALVDQSVSGPVVPS
ncbi:LGFP repeat-containing protein [Kineococcus rhizosphaerae]|uniref:LGFP repeat-containing protein n=1 Tax=Kineococcus rhizosphaerae TaxID=559628 RepID=A0A2T0R2M9_9ACTN|nr:hypothetical protein [Kineococcus rhizosphaerae]PRY14046.1 LGFP repeat-containing protein [Kineococcus rhizosphaerae]